MASTATTALRRQVSALKRAFAKNAALRAQHENTPKKWEASEIALHAAVHELANTAATPALYHALIANDGVVALVHVLAHQNIDIVATTLHTLADLVDTEGETTTTLDAYQNLFDALLAAEAFDAAVAALSIHVTPDSLSADEAAHEVLSHALSLFDHALELRPTVTQGAATRAGMLPYLVGTLTALSFDASSSGKRKREEPLSDAAARIVETLALLLHDAPESRDSFIKADGVPALLAAIEQHPENAGVDADEAALNALGALCGVLLGGAKAREAFGEASGVERVLQIAKKRAALRAPAVRLLDFALMKCPSAVAHAFAAGGVGVLFALLARAGGDVEHVLGALFSMFRYADGEARDRLLFKFWQRGGDKIGVLMGIYARYATALDDGLAGCFLRGEDGEGGGVLDKGLFIVQIAGVIVAELLVYAPGGMREIVLAVMRDCGVGERGVYKAVEAYADSIDEADGGEEALRDRRDEQHRLRELVKMAQKLDEERVANGDG